MSAISDTFHTTHIVLTKFKIGDVQVRADNWSRGVVNFVRDNLVIDEMSVPWLWVTEEVNTCTQGKSGDEVFERNKPCLR